MNGNKPLVSARTITYNHAPYISQCIEGVLMQKTNFPFEYIIAEDCSTDGTREIVFDYAKKYPNTIKVITSGKNVGAHANAKRAFEACSGKYIAICEGDDYWTDPYKLQKQVDFLENNREYLLVHTNYVTVDERGERIHSYLNYMKKLLTSEKKGFITKSLIKQNHIMTLTVLVNKEALFKLQDQILENCEGIGVIDYSLFLGISLLGKIHYDNRKTAAYRVLSDSASHSSDLNKRFEFISYTINISRYFNKKYAISIKPDYFDRVELSAVLREYVIRGFYSKFIKAFCRGVRSDYLNLFRFKNYLYLIYFSIFKK
ncbi:hypothetical protein ES703_107870 [subsurface metagenome]